MRKSIALLIIGISISILISCEGENKDNPIPIIDICPRDCSPRFIDYDYIYKITHLDGVELNSDVRVSFSPNGAITFIKATLVNSQDLIYRCSPISNIEVSKWEYNPSSNEFLWIWPSINDYAGIYRVEVEEPFNTSWPIRNFDIISPDLKVSFFRANSKCQ